MWRSRIPDAVVCVAFFFAVTETVWWTRELRKDGSSSVPDAPPVYTRRSAVRERPKLSLPPCPQDKTYWISGYSFEDYDAQEIVPGHSETKSFPAEYGWKRAIEYYDTEHTEHIPIDIFGILDHQVVQSHERDKWIWGIVREAYTKTVQVPSGTRWVKKQRQKPIYTESAPAYDCVVRGVTAGDNS